MKVQNNFQQPRKIKPQQIALLVFTVFCTLFTLYPPPIQHFQKKPPQTATSIFQDSILTRELLQQSSSTHPENVYDGIAGVDNSSSSKDRKCHEETVDDDEVDDSSSSEDRKSLEDNVFQQSTSPDWPDVTAEALFKNHSHKKDFNKDSNKKNDSVKTETRPNNKERNPQAKPKPKPKPKKSQRRGKKKGKGKKRDEQPLPKEAEKSPRKEFPDNGALISSVTDRGSCDIFSGEWVPNPEAPYYTNMTCLHIQEHQNCMKFGKRDKGYMKWRWKPDNECELPLFDPLQFLELLRGRSLAFVGDSVARNHMQSLICLLSKVVLPIDISRNRDENFKRFNFSDYNFTMSIFWTPYLVKSEMTDPDDVTQPFKLYLDEFDEDWHSQVESYDYIIVSAGQWFLRPAMFYLNGTLAGCLYCQDENVNHLSFNFSYRRALRTAFSAINNSKKFKGVTFLRTFATSHFEGGQWDNGGDCVRIKPFNRNEIAMEYYSSEIYKIQLEELRIAQKVGGRKGLKFRLFDATRPMSLRPDGHPSKYGRSPKQNVSLANDCVHWCLPGPIDTLNDFLQELITREFERTTSLVEEGLLSSQTLFLFS